MGALEEGTDLLLWFAQGDWHEEPGHKRHDETGHTEGGVDEPHIATVCHEGVDLSREGKGEVGSAHTGAWDYGADLERDK